MILQLITLSEMKSGYWKNQECGADCQRHSCAAESHCYFIAIVGRIKRGLDGKNKQDIMQHGSELQKLQATKASYNCVSLTACAKAEV